MINITMVVKRNTPIFMQVGGLRKNLEFVAENCDLTLINDSIHIYSDTTYPSSTLFPKNKNLNMDSLRKLDSFNLSEIDPFTITMIENNSSVWSLLVNSPLEIIKTSLTNEEQ